MLTVAMDKLLLVVEDRFELKDRGLALMPNLPIDSLPQQTLGMPLQIKLERPDGAVVVAKAVIYPEHFNPGGYKLICYVQDMAWGAVPPGTKVWLIET
jgi:hypothetical protein